LEVLEKREVPASGAQLVTYASLFSLLQTGVQLQQAQAAQQSSYVQYQQDKAALAAGLGGVNSATVTQALAQQQSNTNRVQALTTTFQQETVFSLLGVMATTNTAPSSLTSFQALVSLEFLLAAPGFSHAGFPTTIGGASTGISAAAVPTIASQMPTGVPATA
jgi:hypothetical protein